MADVELWYPHAIRDYAPANLWGTYTDLRAPKFLLHTTESPLGSYNPDPRLGHPERRYYGHTNWPTYTIAYGAPLVWRVHQHLPANRAARALANRPGGVETNRANVTQVEIAGRAAEIAVFAATGGMDALAELLAWEHQERGVPLVSSVRWAGSEGYGEAAPQRLSPSAWVAYTGVLGHQHAPGAEGNSHWDPGKFPIGALLQRAREHLAPTYREDTMTPEQETKLLTAIGAIPSNVWRTSPPHDVKQRDMHGVLAETYRKAGAIQRPGLTGIAGQLERVEAAVSTGTGPSGSAVTLDAVHAALDQAVDHDALLGIAEHAMAAARKIRTRPPVLPPTEVTPS